MSKRVWDLSDLVGALEMACLAAFLHIIGETWGDLEENISGFESKLIKWLNLLEETIEGFMQDIQSL